MKVSTVHGGVVVEAEVAVDCFDEFPRDKHGDCVFCHGDPCGETSGHDTLIWKHMHNPDGTWSGQPTCPVCEGRPT